MLIYRQNRIILGLLIGVVSWFLSFDISSASAINSENVVDLVNYSRIKNGLNVLVENSKLNEAALEKARDMIENNYFAHTSPQNATPWVWFEKNDYDYQYAGENLAINFQSAEEEHEAWMESADHKKNILNPRYQEIGVAVQKGIIENKLATITVQMFGAREDFAVVLGDAAKRDSLDLLNRELESGPWSQLAFVKGSDEKIASLPSEPIKNNIQNSQPTNAERWINIFQSAGVIVIMIVMAINPMIVAVMFLQRKNKREDETDISYPVKIILAK